MKTYSYPRDQFMAFLQEAADNGEVIQLTYYGGTHPGDTRPVAPTTVYKTRFRGLCIQTGIEKIYLYEKCYFPQLSGEQKRNSSHDGALEGTLQQESALQRPARRPKKVGRPYKPKVHVVDGAPSGFAESSKRFDRISNKSQAAAPSEKPSLTRRVLAILLWLVVAVFCYLIWSTPQA